MQRASSVANMKIEFNPRQAKVGSSSIDRLPIRKCNSSKSITQISQISQNQQRTVLQTQQYNIEMLKRINQSLQRQNTYLKKQLDFFTQACTSRRNSINNIANIPSKKKQDSGYKDRLMSRIDAKNDTESTGLFNSKMSSGKKGDQLEQTISDIYKKLNLKGQLPKTSVIKQLTFSFMESIKQNFLKLKSIADQINTKSIQSQKLPKQTNDILSFLELTVIHSKNPSAGKNAILNQKQKYKIMKKQPSKQQKIDQMVNQCSLNINDLNYLFESIVKVGIKNTKFITGLRSNLGFSRLIKRMAKNQ